MEEKYLVAHLVELSMAPLLTSVSSLSPSSGETDVKSGDINSSTRWAMLYDA